MSIKCRKRNITAIMDPRGLEGIKYAVPKIESAPNLTIFP
jgi:hypothetical protein